MKFASKLLILLISITFIRLLSSCCSCEDIFYNFNYEEVLVRNSINSRPSDVNSMPANEVAFEIQIVGSEPVLTTKNKIKLPGFKTLSAQNCNCDELFVPNQNITAIRILTINKLNDNFCCNEDVSNLFLANLCANCEDIGTFYITIDELLKRINTDALYHTAINKFKIYLSVPVENPDVQFQIEIELSNGELLSTKTSLIEII